MFELILTNAAVSRAVFAHGTGYWDDSALILRHLGVKLYAVVDGRHRVRAIMELTEEGLIDPTFKFRAWVVKVSSLCFSFSLAVVGENALYMHLLPQEETPDYILKKIGTMRNFSNENSM